MTQMNRVARGMAVVLGAVALGSAALMSRAEAPGLFRPAHRFLLPQGYVGRFRVDFDVPGTPTLPRDGDTYLMRIPASGWLQTSSPPDAGLGPIQCFYASGSSLQRLDFEPGNGAADVGRAPQVRLWGGIVSGSAGDDSGYHEGYFVGTQKQADAALMFPRIGPLQHALWLSGKDRRQARLRGASLRGADLTGVNFLGSDLTRADLSDANLTGANLSATLTGARLCRADLRQADLFEAYLDGADLTDANLEGALLEGADLTGAKLNGARLRGARYDMGTRWPSGFHPAEHGAQRVAAQPGHNRARYLVPKGYLGWIRVDFNVHRAPALPTDSDGYYLVRFPTSGGLKTSSPCTFGHGNVEFFWYSGDRREPLNEERSLSAGEGGIEGYGAHQSYFVGTWAQYRQHAGKGWRLVPLMERRLKSRAE